MNATSTKHLGALTIGTMEIKRLFIVLFTYRFFVSGRNKKKTTRTFIFILLPQNGSKASCWEFISYNSSPLHIQSCYCQQPEVRADSFCTWRTVSRFIRVVQNRRIIMLFMCASSGWVGERAGNSVFIVLQFIQLCVFDEIARRLKWKLGMNMLGFVSARRNS